MRNNVGDSYQTACHAVDLGKLEEIEGKADKRYTGLIVHALQRSAIRNLACRSSRARRNGDQRP